MPKVIPMINEFGNTVKNQYSFKAEDCEFFQSYDDIVAKIDQTQIYIDKKLYDGEMSVTTSKWLSQFLNLQLHEIDEKVTSGDILLIPLND